MHIVSEFLHVSASVNKKVKENVHEKEIFQIATSDAIYLILFDEYSMNVIGYKHFARWKTNNIETLIID